MANNLHHLASKNDPRCLEIAHPNLANFVLSLLILIGILISYLPQHWRIISRRSSDGLSAYFILLGTTSGTCAIANILVLPTSRNDVACCAVNSAFSCAAGLLGIAQVGVQWSCFFLITLLFLIFIPRSGLERRAGQTPLIPTDKAWRDAVLVVGAAIIHFVLTFIITVIMLARFPKHLLVWANILGGTCALLASIQYLPQIYTTWKRQHIGSLSIPMMCIQTPGSFVFASSLAIRLGAQGWSAWTVYIVTGSLQAVLLVMAITFERRDRKNAKREPLSLPDDRSDGEIANRSEDESDPLIQHDRLAERQRQHMIDRRASHPLHPDRLNPDPMSSSSGSSPDDHADNDALKSQQQCGNSTLAGVASSLVAPFRRSSTRWYDANSRRQSRQTPEEETPEDPATLSTRDSQQRPSDMNGRNNIIDGRGAGARTDRNNGPSDQRTTTDF